MNVTSHIPDDPASRCIAPGREFSNSLLSSALTKQTILAAATRESWKRAVGDWKDGQKVVYRHFFHQSVIVHDGGNLKPTGDEKTKFQIQIRKPK